MRADKTEQNLEKPAAPSRNPATLGALRIAAMRLSETRRKPKLKTRDLVGLLLSHGARAWRNSLPPVKVRLAVKTPYGTHAVRYAYGLPKA
ncbi:MAG: hypothetical protein WCC66_10340 [Rhizobiaceae bacterium]